MADLGRKRHWCSLGCARWSLRCAARCHSRSTLCLSLSLSLRVRLCLRLCLCLLLCLLLRLHPLHHLLLRLLGHAALVHREALHATGHHVCVRIEVLLHHRRGDLSVGVTGELLLETCHFELLISCI